MSINVGGVVFDAIDISILNELNLPNVELIYYIDKFLNSNVKCII